MKMLNLHDRAWKEFYIKDIFSISPGKRLTKSDMIVGNKPFIGATDSNNGVTAFVSNTNISEDRNILGVNYNGSVVESFYHPYLCLFSDDVKRFKLKDISATKYHYLFFKTIILQQKCKYAYGYKFNEQRMQKQIILLPVTDSGTPDYDFMERYIKEREQKLTQNYISTTYNNLHREKTPLSLDQKKWGTFFVGDLFTVRRPKARSEKQYKFGPIPFIASGNTNNGLTKCCMPKKEEVLDEGNCITISPIDGSAFYQGTAFLGRGGAGSSILILYNSSMNKYSGLFIARMLTQTCSKYSYGKMGNQESIKREKIMLPIDGNDNPDYYFMEQYIKYISFKLKTKYLKEKNI